MSVEQGEKKPSQVRKLVVRGGLAAVAAAMLGWGGYTWYLVTTNGIIMTKLEQAEKDLAGSRNEAAACRESAKTAQTDLSAARTRLDGLAAEKAACDDKVAAFAKQAASCEVIKKRFHVKE